MALHHNTDIWRTTGAVDNGAVGVWPTCNAWFCSHLWERYLFSGDKQYLEDVYPLMKGAAEFFQDFLVKDPNTGYMVVCPSNSPQNHPGIGTYTKNDGTTANIALFGGVAMDNEMVYDLLKNTALAARALGKDADFADKLDNLKAQLTPWRIGKYGQVQEWQEDWDRETHLIATCPTSGAHTQAIRFHHTRILRYIRLYTRVCGPWRCSPWMVNGMEGSDVGTYA